MAKKKLVPIPEPRDLVAEMVQRADGMWVSPEKLLDDTLGVNLSYPARVLTLHQPYADFITADDLMKHMFRWFSPELADILPKAIENRTWDTYWRGIIFIHAGTAINREEMDRWGLEPSRFTRSAIVGTAELTGIVIDSDSPWALPGHHHWQLGNPQRLTRPIPHRGGQGLRTPKEDLVMQVRDQLVEAVQTR